MWSNATYSSSTATAVSSTVVLTLTNIAEGAFVSDQIVGFGLDAFVKIGATGGSNDPYIGTSRFCWGNAGECCFNATWNFNGSDLICVTFTLPDTGANDYYIQVYDQSSSGSSVVSFRATGAEETICVRASDQNATQTFLSGSHSLNSTTLNVDGATFFSASGTIWIAGKPITYTGKTAFSFTGCSSHPAYTSPLLVAQNRPALANGVNAVNSTTLNVDSTAGYTLTAGLRNLEMLGVLFTYTGKTATSFTGCTAHSATTGGEAVNVPLIGGILAWIGNSNPPSGIHETYPTRLFTQMEAGAGYPGQPSCSIEGIVSMRWRRGKQR